MGITSYFAPAERDSTDQILKDLKRLSKNPVIDSLLTSVGGLLAVLNGKRQIITVNDTLLKSLNIPTSEFILGKRLGEALECIHADEMPGGCGTSRYCSTCGAVIAMVAAMESDETTVRKCHIESSGGGKAVDLSFEVRSCPIEVEGIKFILLFLRDISAQERWDAMERVFFHDINNVLGSVIGSSELLKLNNLVDENCRELILLNKVIKRLTEEITVHKILCSNKGFEELTRKDEFTVNEVCDSLESLFKTHPSSSGRDFEVSRSSADRAFFTNTTLLLRVLTNMLINAFEATPPGGTVKLNALQKDDGVLFSVWNARFIPEETALRVFQKNFTTKDESGRGLGTYGMKLFGEKILGGRVRFTTHPDEGTLFSLYLPIEDR